MNGSNNTGSCNLKLDIPLSEINKIFLELSKDHEVAGLIKINGNDKVIGSTKNKGDKDSVMTPNHVVNFHTHPISAYINAKTVWGWPSGEDVRETILFGLNGNKAHIVFTVEGIYIMQVSQCKLNKIKEILNPVERGVLIFLIEEYFKSTHNFRTYSDAYNLSKTSNSELNPYSWINFINNFNLNNLIKYGKNDHRINETHKESAFKIPSNGFPELEGHEIVTTKLDDYVTSEDLSEFKEIDKYGNYSAGSKMSLKKIKEILKVILKKFEIPCNITWNNAPNSWFFVNFFETDYYSKKYYLNNKGKFAPPTSDIMDLVKISQKDSGNPYIKIFSTKSQGCSFNQIARKNNFNTSNTSNTNNNNSNSFGIKNTFGNSILTPQQRYLLFQEYFIFNPYERNVDKIFENIYNYIVKNKLKIDHLTPEMITYELNYLNNSIKN